MSGHGAVLAIGFILNLLMPPAVASFRAGPVRRHAWWALYAAEWLVIDALFRHWLLASGASASLAIALAGLVTSRAGARAREINAGRP